MTQMETYCTECGQVTTATTPHCSNCGAEDPWDERPAFRFDESDLPFVFSMEVYNDSYELWRSFCNAYWGAYDLKGSDVAGLPDEFPKLKYSVFDAYYVITTECELEGPFLDHDVARDVAAGETDE